MGLENLKSIFSLEDNGNSVVNDTPLTDLNSNLNDTTPFANTNVINFNSDYDNLNTNIYSNTNTYLTTNNEGLQNTSWSSLYNSDGTAKSDVGEIMYPNVSRDNLDKRYQSSTNPFGMRKSMLSSGNEPYEWSNIGHDEPLSGLGLSSDRRFPIMRALKDVSRIGKYLTSTDGILNFIGGQNLLGLMSQVEYYENDELKQAKQRFQAQYNPLSTLTAVGSRFAGIGLPNYLIERSAAVYVEFFRNVPLLLQIFFWYFAALRALPLPQDSEAIFGYSYLTIKGLYTPSFVWENLNIFFYSIIAAIISIVVIKNYAKKLQENQGKQLPVFSISICLLIVLPLLTFLIGGVSLDFEIPVLKQLSTTGFIYEGGLSIPPELIALTLALSLYTATFIAECVRAGIQGISKGQKEAAASIGLTPNQILKLVIMPQALRIIIPPTTNQYLNLTKNSSLAAAIAYPDLVLVFAGTALMQTGRAIEIVSITMLTYLSISLSISLLMNWYNKKIAIKEK